MEKSPIVHQPARRVQRRSTLLEDFVTGGTTGERSNPDEIIDVTLAEFDHRFMKLE